MVTTDPNDEVCLLINPVGLDNMFDAWPEADPERWRRIHPVPAAMDECVLAADFVAAAESKVRGRRAVIVAAGDAAHLALHLLALAKSGTCALITPPVGPYLSREDLQPGLLRISRSLNENPALGRALDAMAEESPTTGHHDQEQWFSFIEDVVMPSLSPQEQREADGRLLTYRQILDRQRRNVPSVETSPWWHGIERLGEVHRVKAFFVDEQPIPHQLPVKAAATDWPAGWWRSDSSVVARDLSHFIEHP